MKNLGPQAQTILDALAARAGTGNSLMSRLRMKPDTFRDALQELKDSDLVVVKGGDVDDLGDAYIYVPPAQKQRSSMLRKT